MIRNPRLLAPIAALLALSACGKMGDLEPAANKSMPPVAYGENGKQTAEKLLTPSTQARPTRSDELVKKSTTREADPFDLAPGQEVPPFPDTEEAEQAAKDKDKKPK